MNRRYGFLRRSRVPSVVARIPNQRLMAGTVSFGYLCLLARRGFRWSHSRGHDSRCQPAPLRRRAPPALRTPTQHPGAVTGLTEMCKCLEYCARSAGIAQLVEHNLAKVGVASSSLVSRSRYPGNPARQRGFAFLPGPAAGSEDQHLAEWQSGYAADCKSVDIGSIPVSASTPSVTSRYPAWVRRSRRMACTPQRHCATVGDTRRLRPSTPPGWRNW